ncbi:energy-coupling factor transporter transmembrane component T family protein [Nocardia anaemiae]|uniref:energy-coupling factor transporter transmembrane component T family protein n=1 Tax=Nocardia anaemiae TaxID=263910 RepID=UPI0007A393A1|nr:energy-coupling factor transporter transmembrane protein EcfT [Nocardia anaemiae]
MSRPKTSSPARPLVLMRPVPGRTPVHALWAGTKLITVMLLAALLTFFPGWPSITLVAVFVLATARLAGVPRGAVPSMPRTLWIMLAAGAVVTAASGGAPTLGWGSVRLGVGGLLDYLQLILLAVVLLGVCALVSWTTNAAEVAPAVSTLGRPLRALRLPVDDWAATIALALRAFPMLSREFRVLSAARRLRPRPATTTRRDGLARRSTDLIDLLTAAMTAALRRADEMGDAITARGGSGQLAALPARPRTADALALAVVFAVCGLSIYLETGTSLAVGS